jgi:hypothetical protein
MRLRSQISARSAVLVLALLAVSSGAATFALAKGGPPAARAAQAAKGRAGISASFPLNQGFYGAAQWHGGCQARVGLCGTALVPKGFNGVVVSVQRIATHRYLNGRNFKSRRLVYRAAALLSRPRRGKRAQPARWFYRLPLPRPDGQYAVRVMAVNRAHKVMRARATRTLTFTIDTVAPAAPLVTAGPAGATSASSASFSFAGQESGLSYRCQLDGQSWGPCAAPATYAGLGAGTHTFVVEAIDRAGNVSAPAQRSWLITANPAVPAPATPPSAGVPFTITGDVSGLLSPGAPARAIPLKLTNPNDATIFVTGLTASLQASSLPAGCAASNYRIAPASIPGTGITVPAHASVTLPVQGAAAPTIQLIETFTNQDACERASLVLGYAGSAHS